MTDFRVLFLGRGADAASILERVLDAGFSVPLIATSRHFLQAAGEPEQFERIAAAHGIPFLYSERPFTGAELERIEACRADIGLALFWHVMIDARTIASAGHGLLNLHPGLLPRYRGNACANWAILNGETEMGITLHFMAPDALDAGPVVAQRTVPISARTVVGELMTAARDVGAEMILDVLSAYREGRPPPLRPQDPAKALRCYPRLPRDGSIDWSDGAVEIDRLVRSLGPPYEHAYTHFEGARWDVVAAEPICEPPAYCAVPGHVVATSAGGPITVATGSGLLEVSKIRHAGRVVAPGDLVRGVRKRLGRDLEAEIAALRERVVELEGELRSLRGEGR